MKWVDGGEKMVMEDDKMNGKMMDT